MLQMDDNTFDRAAHCRRIASKGGRATVQKHGRDHMAKIGRKGFRATTQKWFGGDEEKHKQWLATVGFWVYWLHSGLPMRYGPDGKPFARKPAHPSRNEVIPF
jgi:general stress protein YciG